MCIQCTFNVCLTVSSFQARQWVFHTLFFSLLLLLLVKCIFNKFKNFEKDSCDDRVWDWVSEWFFFLALCSNNLLFYHFMRYECIRTNTIIKYISIFRWRWNWIISSSAPIEAIESLIVFFSVVFTRFQLNDCDHVRNELFTMTVWHITAVVVKMKTTDSFESGHRYFIEFIIIIFNIYKSRAFAMDSILCQWHLLLRQQSIRCKRRYQRSLFQIIIYIELYQLIDWRIE